MFVIMAIAIGIVINIAVKARIILRRGAVLKFCEILVNEIWFI